MKTNVLKFTLFLITTTLTYTSQNHERAANGSYRLPPSKHFEKSRADTHEPSKSSPSNSTQQ